MEKRAGRVFLVSNQQPLFTLLQPPVGKRQREVRLVMNLQWLSSSTSSSPSFHISSFFLSFPHYGYNISLAATLTTVITVPLNMGKKHCNNVTVLELCTLLLQNVGFVL